jgi:hypothetical protein
MKGIKNKYYVIPATSYLSENSFSYINPNDK